MDSTMIADKVLNGNEPGAADNEVLDILDRQEFLNRLIFILTLLSNNKNNSAFAIDGVWGSGKTFVLDLLEKELSLLNSEDTQENKFIVFRYNCWQYDYYDEPAEAIISAMLDYTANLNWIGESAKRTWDIAKNILYNVISNITKSKLGIDVVETLKNADESSAERKNEDSYSTFKKTIDITRNELQKLAEKGTLIIIVDELDRCLPQYAIKVLERLHHIFYGLKNTILILAVDKTQLEATVKQIFGSRNENDIKEYLKKFIDFEIVFNKGSVNNKFSEKHADYIKLFDETLFETKFSIDDYFTALFAGIDVRTQEQIVFKAKLLHQFIFGKVKTDYAVMCVELLWLVLIQYYGMTNQDIININIKDPFSQLTLKKQISERLTKFFANGFGFIKVTEIERNSRFMTTKIYKFLDTASIPELVIWYWQQLLFRSGIVYTFPDTYSDASKCEMIAKKLKKFERFSRWIE